MKYILWLTVISTLCLGSCRLFGKRIKGNGNITTVSNNARGYTGISVSGSIDVYVRTDSAQSVKVTTDDNLQEYIDISEDGGKLRIKVKGNYNLKPTSGIKVYVAGPDFRNLSASGACDLFTEGRVTGSGSVSISLSGACDADLDLNAPRISGNLSGAGSLTLKGETRDLELDGSGSSSFKCLGLMSENVDVDITGSGDAEVFASVKLDVSVTGSGSVKYKGNASVSQRVTGSGSVRKLE
jgi:hypothetical protein